MAVNLYEVRDRTDRAAELFRSIQRQKDQYQGIWIVSPDGKVLAGHHDVKNPSRWTEEVLATIDAALASWGNQQPRGQVKSNPLSHWGRGVQTDGTVTVALYTRYLLGGGRGLAPHDYPSSRLWHYDGPLRADGPVVIDSIRFTKDEWKMLLPSNIERDTVWSVPAEIAAKFYRLLSATSDQAHLRGRILKVNQLQGRIESIRNGRATIRWTGQWETDHPYEGQRIRLRTGGEGVAICNVNSQNMLSFLLVCQGAELDEAGIPTRPLGGVVEWVAEVSADELRASIAKALPLLEKGARGAMRERPQCFTCHHQGLPILALTTARQQGFAIDEEHLHQQVAFTAAFLAKNRDKYREGRGQGGQVMTAGYALWSLEAGGYTADETTAAVAEYLLRFQAELDHWRSTSNRPPSESSHFTATYLAIRGLQRFSTGDQQDRAEERIRLARVWLCNTQAEDTEDRVFRLWGLKLSGADENQVRVAASELWRSQRTDGGWAQADGMASDAYATGSALVALRLAAGVATNDAAFQRGVRFLLDTQQDDGSWYVKSRSKPFQTYFESGFPHGADQFISITATGWATMALALSFPAEDCGTTAK